MKNDSRVLLEFWFRGTPLSKKCAEDFSALLSDVRELDEGELEEVAEVWRASVGERIFGGVQFAKQIMIHPEAPTYKIVASEVGELHGRRMLAIWWEHNLFDRKFLSIFTDAEDGPGLLVHEVHFSAPTDDMYKHATTIVDTLRSFQWTRELPPPMISQSKLSA